MKKKKNRVVNVGNKREWRKGGKKSGRGGH